MLINGSTFGASAINNTSDRTNHSISSSTYLADETFSVSIGFVGYGSTDGQRISLDADGSYHYVADDADQGFNLVRLKTNITGYTCWGTCTDSSITGDRSLWDATGGATYIIVDGNVLPAGFGYMSTSGGDVAISSIGDHVVTFLMIGKDEADGVVYAQDTITIRIALSESDFIPLNVDSVSATTSVTDSATVHSYNDSAVAFDSGYYSYWTKADQYRPTTEFALQQSGANVTGVLEGVDTSSDTFNIWGAVNSTGFDGNQAIREQTSTIGNTFLYDASGLTPLSDVTELSFFNNRYSDCNFIGSHFFTPTHVGLITFADNGRWIKEGVTYGPYQAHFADFEGLNRIYDSANFSNYYDLNASMDFADNYDVNPYWFSTETSADTPATCVSTSFTTTTNTSSTTTTETTTNTNSVDVTETSVKTESPGFGVIVSLLSIGVIAFVAPRLRREN
jgi:hypothetical protein